MKKVYIIVMALILLVGLSVSGHATLIDMGDGTIYDTDLQLSWLQDANYANTSGYDAGGLMTWSAANTWADNLVFAGFDNWRLPTTLQPDPSCGYQGVDASWGYNCTGSEMGHLYYTELGNSAHVLMNMGDFTDLHTDFYWSGTEYAQNTNLAWSFVFSDVFNNDGRQDSNGKLTFCYALAVRPGERSTSVPEPATLLLLCTGLAGIAVWRKRLGRKEG